MGRKGLDGYHDVEEDRGHGTHRDQREGEGHRSQADRDHRRWRLAVGGDRSIVVYDSNDGLHWTCVKRLDVPLLVSLLAWNPAADSIICAAGTEHDNIMVWNVSSGSAVATIEKKLSHPGWWSGVCWSSCGRRIAATGSDRSGSDYSGWDNFVRVWELPMGRENVQVTQPMGMLQLKQDPAQLDWSPDGNWIAIGVGNWTADTVGNELRLWAAPR